MFVGRLDASQKGHDTFLDALACLEACEDTPFYSAWLIGGDTEEAAELRDELRLNAHLEQLWQTGRLHLWSRVAYEALPEFYSRATILVMPSRSETFGLVAIEAMACGAPVIAGRVGGLKDTVRPRLTGAHITPGDHEALAMVMLSWLKNPAMPEYLSQNAQSWAKTAFGHSSPQSGLNRLLRFTEGGHVEPHLLEQTDHFGLEPAREEIETWLGPVASVRPFAMRHNRLWRVEQASGEVCLAKHFLSPPKTDAGLYPQAPGLRDVDYKVRVNRTLAASQRPAGTEVSAHQGLWVTMPILEPAEGLGEVEHLEVLSNFHSDLDNPVPQLTLVTLDNLQRQPDRQRLYEADYALAALNAPLTGYGDVFVRAHPGVELIRLMAALAPERFVGPRSQADALRELCALALESQGPFSTLQPKLQHGDVKAEHFLSRDSETVLCDGEWMCAAFGPLDIASYAINTYLRVSDVSPVQAARVIREHCSFDEQDGALAWVCAQLCHFGLVEAAWGDPDLFRAAPDLISAVMTAHEQMD